MSSADDPDAEKDAEPAGEADYEATTGQEEELSWEAKQKDSEQADGGFKGYPEYRDFFSEGDPKMPAKLVSSDSSAGAIPAVEPFNFGRDPGVG